MSEGLTTVQRELHRYYEANGAERFRQFVDFGGLKADTPEDWLEVFETQMIQGLAPLKRAVQGMEALRTGVKYGRYKRMLTEEGLPDSIEDDAFRLAEQAKGSTMKAFVALERTWGRGRGFPKVCRLPSRRRVVVSFGRTPSAEATLKAWRTTAVVSKSTVVWL